MVNQNYKTDQSFKNLAIIMPEKSHAYYNYYSSFNQLIGKKASIWQQILVKEEHQDYYSFALPKDWSQRETLIRFDGVQGAFYFWLNGKRTGLCKEAESTEYNISQFLKEQEENTIKIEPINSALLGNITLMSLPKLHVRDYFASCTFDDHYENANFKLEVEVRNKTEEDQAIQLEVYLSESLNRIEENHINSSKLVAKKLTDTKISIEEYIRNPKKWTEETPNLYYGAIVMKYPTGQVISITKFEFGFRSIEVHEGGLCINGQSLFLKGINGKQLKLQFGSENQYKNLFAYLKKYNFNTIKFSASKHPFLCQLCNKYGLYIIDELPDAIELFETDDMALLENMIASGRNHPSIISWSFGNRQENGERYLEMKKRGLLFDTLRPYHYEGDLDLIISDFLSKKEATIDYIEKVGKDQEKYKKPAILSDFGEKESDIYDLNYYLSSLSRYKNWCGILLTSSVIDNMLKNKGEALMIKHVFQNIEIKEVALSENKISILNKNTFADLEGCYLKWQLLEDGEVLKKGSLSGVKIPAMQSEEFVLPIGVYQQLEAAEYHLNVQLCLPEGVYDNEEVLGWAQFKMPYEVIIKAKKMIQKTLTVYDKRIKVEILGEDFSIRISKLTGDITSLVFEDKEYLLSPLRLTLDRPKQSIFAKLLGKKSEEDYKVQGVSIENLKTEVIIKVLRKVKNVKNSMITEYTIEGNGNLYVEHQLTPKKNLYKFGSSMAISKEFNKISWFGKGIGEDLLDKQTGEKIGVYTCNINEYMNYFTDDQECNKTEIRWFSATTEDGEGLIFEDANKTLLNMSALPYVNISSKNERISRMKDTIMLNIDYNEKGFDENFRNTSKKEQLQKNVEYQYRYKICRAF